MDLELQTSTDFVTTEDLPSPPSDQLMGITLVDILLSPGTPPTNTRPTTRASSSPSPTRTTSLLPNTIFKRVNQQSTAILNTDQPLEEDMICLFGITLNKPTTISSTSPSRTMILLKKDLSPSLAPSTSPPLRLRSSLYSDEKIKKERNKQKEIN